MRLTFSIWYNMGTPHVLHSLNVKHEVFEAYPLST